MPGRHRSPLALQEARIDPNPSMRDMNYHLISYWELLACSPLVDAS